MKFIDEVVITVASGHGGAGAVSFRREAMVPRGGPDGGDGGRGGDLIFRAVSHLNSLVDYRRNKKYAAENGRPGEGSNRTGADGNSRVLLVPKGTVVRNRQGQVLVDLTEVEEMILLKGGRGGKGNAFFKTSVNQAPEYAQPGEPGEELEISMELKLIADVGIIGLPNAGKSTLISRISAARPKIADYPFTTLTPNLGVVKMGEFRSFVVADIPGLIKDAHKGVGLGTQFLRHVERTKVFVHLIDISSYPEQPPTHAFNEINYELEMYDKMNKGKEGFFPLCSRKQVIVFNKIDTLSSDKVSLAISSFKKEVGKTPLAISAVSGKNIDQLLTSLEELIKEESP